MELRRATPDDWLASRDVRLRSLEQDPNAYCASLEQESRADEQQWRARLGRGLTMVAWDGDEPVATVSAKADPHEPGGQELAAMWVDPRARGKGLASQLISAVVDWAKARGAHELALWVAEDNRHARGIYERCGFTATGEREVMRPGVDQLRMRMPLAKELAPETPYLAVDIDVLERNLQRAADDAAAKGLALRPHGKTHKIPELARRQLAHGAIGLTLATVSEAEIFAEAGIDDIFIAYPVWPSPARAARIRSLASRITLRLGVDSIETAEALGAALEADAGGIEVIVEVDSGHHRSGVLPEEAGAVAAAAQRAGLRVGGVFTFPGHSYAPGAGEQAVHDEETAIDSAVASLAREGIDAVIRSGGSTPSWGATGNSSLTEARPGVYVFNDAQQLELETCGLADIALTVMATVVSRHGRDVVTDAGSKVLGADRAAWATGYGRLLDVPDARIHALSEHHSTIRFPEGVELPDLGSTLRIVPNHVCNTVNLANEVFVVRAGVIIDEWAVAARGANS